jgi:hypothetical protein
MLFPLVALAMPMCAEPTPRQVQVPSIAEIPEPTSASLRSIEAQSGDLPQGSIFEIYRWDRFPHVIVLDMADFTEQDRMFSRLAFFLEKRGYRGRLLSDAELAGKHGWNAHDYGPDGLASFFNKAVTTRFPLDSEETLLRDIAIREGIVTQRGDNLFPGSGAILSISRSSSKYERILLLAHESYHGIYFCSLKYRDLCARTWATAPASEKRFMRRLLEYLGYDDSDMGLVVNEFQAYLLQQPRPMASAYFERVGKLIANGDGIPEAADVLPDLLKDEAILEAFLMSTYAIGAGGVAQRAEGGR